MNIHKRNFILAADFYKQTHHLQTPKGTQVIVSYLESRGGKFDETLFFGLQGYIKDYLVGVVIEQWMIEEADELLKEGFGFDYFNRAGWQRIVDVHGGRLPIKIRAVKEGSVVPTNNVLLTIENTDENVPFLTNFVETSLLRGTWYPITIATLSYNIKKVIKTYSDETGVSPSPFALNDFGSRGITSDESAGIGGAAHLVNFLGTDNIEGVLWAKKYYNSGVCGYSVFATEHSTTTIYGKENELKAYEHFLDTCPDEAIASFVIDSYNTEGAVKDLLGGKLKNRILSRKGKVVFRPDSGNPVEMSLKVVSWLYEIFGGTINALGYKELNPRVGCIYGDGISFESIGEILKNLKNHGFAANTIIFGSGGALLQGSTRDTMKFAIKASAAKINDVWVDVFKDPITDNGKRSKKGRLALINYDNKGYTTVPESLVLERDNLLVPVFENGVLLNEYTFDQVKENSKLNM